MSYLDERIKIDGIELYQVAIPLLVPFEISGGRSYNRQSIIIKMTSGDLVGYGESAPFDAPFYSSETISSVKAMLHEWLIPKVVGKEFTSIEELNSVLAEGIRGNNFAKAGLENAYWDLVAKKNNLRLVDAIKIKLAQMGVDQKHLEYKEYIESGVSVGIPGDRSLDTLKTWVADYVEEGYRRIKIKIKPGWDIEPARAAREVIGPDFLFWVDANSSYELENSEVFREMDQLGCTFYEQPLNHDDILDHAALAKNVKTPICLDESLKSFRVGRQVIELGGIDVWNIKVQRIGGLLEGLKLYKLAVENNIKLWGGTMPESGVGAMPILALASFNGFVYPADVEASARWYGMGKDLIEIEMDKKGRIYLPEGLGIGTEPNWQIMEKYGRKIASY
ncbi:MAG: o-succinylbenzoate synthase [Bacillota bacterium]|jgi:O-succinylbenzoate synthase|nr:o-succinylbenzoate synthase [Bacillota bacterium]NLU54237.1 o-succinylbenzoate synthase [Bacillota bacterium]HOA91843.1 o-succinylbenzoate synthase [Bacillota bacterium]HOJ46238.1 o-succinylbenzoate synthase [Bacillota bacterium]HOL12916.1 o-succinylbenzoate synthase [Bacillota bacterium]